MRSAIARRSRVIGTRCSARAPRARGGQPERGFARGRRRALPGPQRPASWPDNSPRPTSSAAVAAGRRQRLSGRPCSPRPRASALGLSLRGIRPAPQPWRPRLRGGLRRAAAGGSRWRCRSRRAPAAGAAPSSITASTWPLVTVVPSANLIFLQHAGRRRGNLEHHLVGLQIDEIFIARDGLAGLLVPRDQRGVSHRLRQLRHANFDCHESSSPSLSSRHAHGLSGGLFRAACPAAPRCPDSSGCCSVQRCDRRCSVSGFRSPWRRPRPARPAYSSSLASFELQAMTNLIPAALILRLFLAPDDLARIRVLADSRLVLLRGKGIQLLDAHDGDDPIFASRRDFSKSKYTLPLQSTMRVTAPAGRSSISSITAGNRARSAPRAATPTRDGAAGSWAS